MRRFASTAIVAGVCALGFAGPTITVTPTIAPNVFGSSNWGSWVSNEFQAQYQGLTAFGTPGTPAYYAANSVVTDRRQVIVTGYNSWLGDANPTGAFANEYGNRMHFALHIMGNGSQFSISNLMFDSTSTGDGNGLGFGFTYGDYDYSNDYVGIQYGNDGIRGTADDVLITGGANTQLVDELIGRGSGNSYDSYVSDPGATNQDKLDGVAALHPWDTYVGVYTLRDNAGAEFTGAGTFAAVPEPTSMAALGLGALALLRKRRKKA